MIPVFGERFPYTNFHDLNLDWIIATLKEVLEKVSDKIKVADPIDWDITKQYPQYTLVVDNNIAYLSKKNVPEGIEITNTEYWEPIFDLTAIYDELTRLNAEIEAETEAREEAIDDLRDATMRNNKAKHLLYCGDSYSVYFDNLLYRTFVSVSGIPASQCHNLAISGASFTPGLASTFIEQVQGYTGDRNEITDIIVVGGINDALLVYGSYTDTYPDFTVTSTAMHNFITYCHTQYPNAEVHLAYVGGCLPSSQYYETLHPARSQEIALFLYTSAGKTYGFDVLNCYNTIHLASAYYSDDGLHPSYDGTIEIASAVASAFNGKAPAEARPEITSYVNTHPLHTTGIYFPVVTNIKDGVCSMTFTEGYTYLKEHASLGNVDVTPVGFLSGSCPNIKGEVRATGTVIINNFYKNTDGTGTIVTQQTVDAEYIMKDGVLSIKLFDMENGSYNTYYATGTDSTITFKGFTITTPTFNVN